MLSRFTIPLKYIDSLTTTPAAHFPFRGVFPSANFFEPNPLEKVDLQAKRFPQERKWAAFARICSTTQAGGNTIFLLTNNDFQLDYYLRHELLQLLIAKTPAGIARSENPLYKAS
jgi:hypothetical protein